MNHIHTPDFFFLKKGEPPYILGIIVFFQTFFVLCEETQTFFVSEKPAIFPSPIIFWKG